MPRSNKRESDWQSARPINGDAQKVRIIKPVMIIGGIVVLIIMILIFKQYRNSNGKTATSAEELPSVLLDRALQAGQPTLAFFHSNNCQQCITMMETVAQVYPVFSNTVSLVDVDVYDEDNAALLQSVGLQYITTLIFFDHAGKGQVSVGVMDDEQLRQTLAALAGGE